MRAAKEQNKHAAHCSCKTNYMKRLKEVMNLIFKGVLIFPHLKHPSTGRRKNRQMQAVSELTIEMRERVEILVKSCRRDFDSIEMNLSIKSCAVWLQE